MTSPAPPKVSFEHGVVIIEPGTEYSHLYEPMLEHLAIVRQLADSAEPACLIFDLKHVDFIGSAFIGYLVSVSQALAKRGGSFGLANGNKFCQTTINLAQLSSLLPLYDSVEAAAEALSADRV